MPFRFLPDLSFATRRSAFCNAMQRWYASSVKHKTLSPHFIITHRSRDYVCFSSCCALVSKERPTTASPRRWFCALRSFFSITTGQESGHFGVTQKLMFDKLNSLCNSWMPAKKLSSFCTTILVVRFVQRWFGNFVFALAIDEYSTLATNELPFWLINVQ